MNTVTDLRSFLRGVSFDNESYLDQLKTVDNIIIDMCYMVDVFENSTSSLLVTNYLLSILL